MGKTPSKKDRILPAIFEQLEMLQELAIEAGDPELAQDLSAALAGALFRYCDQKRAELRVAIGDDKTGKPRKAR